jgi:hypothetical protein
MIAKNLKVISILNVEIDPGPMEEVDLVAESSAKKEAELASEQKRKSAKKEDDTLVDTDTDVDNPHKKKLKKKLKINIKIPPEDQAMKGSDSEPDEPKIKSPPTKRQRRVIEEREEQARKLEEEHEQRVEDNKRVRWEWQNESKVWRTKTAEMVAGVQKEMALRGDQHIIDRLDQVDKLLMKEKRNAGDDKNVLATLKDCFPITPSTGEVKDKALTELSHLKYIPEHTIGAPHHQPRLPGSFW